MSSRGEDDLEQLQGLLSSLEISNEYLKNICDEYQEELTKTTHEAHSWEAAFKAADGDLRELRIYLEDLRQRWSSERCAEFGHFDLGTGSCTDCGEEICR